MFLWGAACNAVIYGIATIVALVNLRAHKSARLYFPVLIIVMGVISTFSVLLISCLIIAAIFDTMALPFNELYAFACGFLPVLILFIFSFLPLKATVGVYRGLAALLVGLLLAYFSVSLDWFFPVNDDSFVLYSAIFDAGSTGSRARVFTVLQNATDECQYRLVNEVAFSAEPGLSDFAKFPIEAAVHLRPLLEAVKWSIPRHKLAEASLVLRATAGLRLLPDRTAKALLEAVFNLFNTSGFQLDRDNAVGILDGVDEGLFAWLALVFLRDDSCLGRTHHTAAPMAIFDLGGASFQLTFLVTSMDIESLSRPGIQELPHVYKGTQFAPKDAKLYAHSFLGLGLIAAMHSMLLKSNDRPTAANAAHPRNLSSPCFPQNVVGDWKYAGGNWTVTSGDFNIPPQEVFKVCYEIATNVLSEHGLGSPEFRLEELKQQDIRAISFMCSKTEEAETVLPRPLNGQVPVQWYFDAAKEYCSNPRHEQPFKCMEMTYISAILSFGFGLPMDKQLDLNRNIRGIEVGWPVGYLVDKLIRS